MVQSTIAYFATIYFVACAASFDSFVSNFRTTKINTKSALCKVTTETAGQVPPLDRSSWHNGCKKEKEEHQRNQEQAALIHPQNQLTAATAFYYLNICITPELYYGLSKLTLLKAIN
jgi:hypothetical protein